MLNVQQLVVVVWVDAILERKQEETASTTTCASDKRWLMS